MHGQRASAFAGEATLPAETPGSFPAPSVEDPPGSFPGGSGS
jgi:hypothetical protein